MTLRCWFLSVRIVLHSDLTSTLLNTISMKSYLPEPPSPAGLGSNAITCGEPTTIEFHLKVRNHLANFWMVVLLQLLSDMTLAHYISTVTL